VIIYIYKWFKTNIYIYVDIGPLQEVYTWIYWFLLVEVQYNPCINLLYIYTIYSVIIHEDSRLYMYRFMFENITLDDILMILKSTYCS
jgi:hypothetical protein